MLSPRMVARIAFPLGYTCQSGAKLSVRRLDPREVPNVCLGVCISRAVSCVTWDKGGKEREEREERGTGSTVCSADASLNQL